MIGNEHSAARKRLTRAICGNRSRAGAVLVYAAFALTVLTSRSVAAQTVLAEVAKPPAPPPAWIGLFDEYGGDSRLLVSERDGSLYVTVEWLTPYPIREPSPDVFEWPHSGLYDGERVVFGRGANGSATQVTIGGVVFPRRRLRPESATQLHVVPVRPVEELLGIALTAAPPVEPPSARHADLVELIKLDSTIKLEIRYASTNNFLGSRMYTEARAFMQRPAAAALVRVSSELHKRGYGLLVRALEREIGASPLDLALGQRLLTVAQLLTETTAPVTQVAYASGFQSLRRFNTVFRERFQMSPTGWRRRTTLTACI